MSTPAKASTPRTPRRSRRRKAGLWLLLSLAVLVLVSALSFLSLTATPLTVPDWAARKVEEKLNQGLGAGRVSLGQVQLVVDRTLVPRVRMRDVGVYDARGVEVARLNEVRARLVKSAMIQGMVEVDTLRVSGAQITVRRRADGTFDLSLGTGASTSGTLAGVLDGLDQAFARQPLSELRRIEADQLTITLEDGRSGRLWQVTEGRMTLQQSPTTLDLTVSADVFNGTEDLATLVIGFRTEKGSPQASLTATFENAAAGDIAAQSPALAFLDVLEAPISGALRAAIDAGGELDGMAGTLEIGQGALQPTPDTPPIRFDGARAYVAYDPDDQILRFSQVTVLSDAAEVTAEGRAFLRDFRAGWPATLVGQFALTDVVVQPADVFTEPMRFARGAVDFRLRLDPFSVEVGQVALQAGDQRFNGRGDVHVLDAGWGVSLDLTLNTIPLSRLLALWPVALAPGARKWLDSNIISGDISDLTGAFRYVPDAPPQISLSYVYSGAEVKVLPTLPPIIDGAGYASIVGKTYTTVIEAGRIIAPDGGEIDMAGSVFRVGDLTARPGRAEIALQTDSTITAALSLLDLPPFNLMQKAQMQPDVAQGRAVLRSDIGFDLLPVVTPDDVGYQVAGTLRDVYSDQLVAGRTVSAARLDIRASRDGVTIAGPGRLGKVPANVTWSQQFGPEAASGSRVEGTVEVSQAFLDEFNIGLPRGAITGKGIAQISVDLQRDKAPEFTLVSDLNRVGLRLDAVGWSKPRNATGRLEVAGRLGQTPRIDRLVLDAPGLRASGVIDLREGGAMERAQFDRVQVGRWLDGPVTLTGRGNRTPAVSMSGGLIDLRAATFGKGGGGGGGGGGPIDLALDRLVVSEGITLTSFSGRFDNTGGLGGRFSARVNGKTPVSGTVVATPAGSAVRIISDDAGGAVAAAGVLQSARGGSMDLTLNPTGAEGVYDGRLAVRRTRIVDAPGLTAILSAISIVGLLDQMNTGGISLSEVDAEFRLTPTRVTLYRSSAIGPSLGISLDGIYDLTTDRMDMQGVVSPVYFLNGIGQIFSKRGEGVFGFNFRMRGDAQDPNVTVNPLSILTPGMFREIFRRPPPTPAPARGQ